jgi:C4-dicarboxylate transporter DctM subunit
MTDFNVTLIVLGLLVFMVLGGMHIAVALGLTSLVGIYLVTESVDIVINALGSVAFEGLRGYIFIALPLFMLMGEFISRSGAAQDLYAGINQLLRRIPARLALATILGNAVFAFMTGVSLAAAAAFTRVAYPQMVHYGYRRDLACAVIAGSACLGMLIPPSNLMILWAILTEGSIGAIFLAGIVPGLLLVTFFVGYVVVRAKLDPKGFGQISFDPKLNPLAQSHRLESKVPTADILKSAFSIFGMIFCVLGGIWFGFFTPTEAAGVGVVLAVVFGHLVKGMKWIDFQEGILQVGRTAAPLMIMILMALFYSRALALTGIGSEIEAFFLGNGFSKWSVLAFMVFVWFLLGMIIDSKSIMLLTVPIFAPLADAMGFDPVAFAIIGILAIETGLLTPPFGLIIYTVRASANDDQVAVWSIFKASTPYWIGLLLVLVTVAIWPIVATGLARLIL